MQQELEAQLCMKLALAKRLHIIDSPHMRKKLKTAKAMDKEFQDSQGPESVTILGAMTMIMTKQMTLLGDLRA